jgi:hypothetical protein
MSTTPPAARPLPARASGHPARASPYVTGGRDRQGPTTWSSPNKASPTT